MKIKSILRLNMMKDFSDVGGNERLIIMSKRTWNLRFDYGIKLQRSKLYDTEPADPA